MPYKNIEDTRAAQRRYAKSDKGRNRQRAYMRMYRARMTAEEKAEQRHKDAAYQRRKKAADKFDREFNGLPENMICCNPNCNNPQVSDQFGPTGLCAEHQI